MEIVWEIEHPWLGALEFTDGAYPFVCGTWRVVISDAGHYSKIRRKRQKAAHTRTGRARLSGGKENLPLYLKTL